MLNAKPAVIYLTETWLDKSVSASVIYIEGFSVVCKDRNRYEGGVCTYIRSDIAFSGITDIPSEDIEATWLELLLPKTKHLLIGTCYRPTKQHHLIDKLENILTCFRSDTEWYILGDINICYKQKKSLLFKKYD